MKSILVYLAAVACLAYATGFANGQHTAKPKQPAKVHNVKPQQYKPKQNPQSFKTPKGKHVAPKGFHSPKVKFL
jgi:hypothetical protein